MSDSGGERTLTGTPYQPDDALGLALLQAGTALRVEGRDFLSHVKAAEVGTSQRFVALYMSGKINELSFRHISDKVDELTVCQTRAPFGAMTSLKGESGVAAAAILLQSILFGEPTIMYRDEYSSSAGTERYQDLNAEWYLPWMAGTPLPELRIEIRPNGLEATEVDLETVERWARRHFEEHKGYGFGML